MLVLKAAIYFSLEVLLYVPSFPLDKWVLNRMCKINCSREVSMTRLI